MTSLQNRTRHRCIYIEFVHRRDVIVIHRVRLIAIKFEFGTRKQIDSKSEILYSNRLPKLICLF